VRRAGIVVLAVLVGLAAGAIWTFLQSDRYRADARVLVRPASSRVVPAVEALAESSLVEANVAQTLHLSRPPHISAKRGDGGVLTVSVEAGGRERARQVDAEAVVILAQKVAQRFGAGGTTATVLDPAHVAEQTSPTPGRNLLITGLAGLVLGVAAAAALSSRRASAPAPAPVDPAVEERLQSRIGQVTQRERTLAQRAGQLAAREQDLERRQRETEQRAAEVEAAAAAAAAAAAEPEPEPEPEPELPSPPEPQLEPEPEPQPWPSPTPRASWTLGALEQVTRERSERASAEQQEEWADYLFLLREHADADGALPSSFEPLIINIFGPLQQPDE
jgi:capsular polysaccharide biosynthesis protein